MMYILYTLRNYSHFLSWHGKFGIMVFFWAWIQVAFGIALGSFQGRLIGGRKRAKALYKWHRLVTFNLIYPFFSSLTYKF